MAIKNVQRLTFTEQFSRNVVNKDRHLAIEVSGPNAFGTRAVEVMNNLPAILAIREVKMKFYTPNGIELNAAVLIGKTIEEIDDMAAKIDSLSQAAAERTPPIKIPEMININDKVRIMKNEMTVGLFKKVMEGYEITGNNADELRVILSDPAQEGNALTYVAYWMPESLLRD
jgi:hypothetical protein